MTDEKMDLGLNLNYWMYPIIGLTIRKGDFRELSIQKTVVENYRTERYPCDPTSTVDENVECLLDGTRRHLINTNCSKGPISIIFN